MQRLLCFCAAAVSAAVSSPAQTFQTIFTLGEYEGVQPTGTLAIDQEGVIYGTTYGGAGIAPAGSVFKLTRGAGQGEGSWLPSTIYIFKGGEDADNPVSGLVAGKNGALYGSTINGGIVGAGAIYRLVKGTEGWTENVIYSFVEQYGSEPNSMIIAPDGTLFGTTEKACCIEQSGVVFALAPPLEAGDGWGETFLTDFPPNNVFSSVDPVGLVQAPNGVLYGATAYGGTYSGGSLFELTPPTSGTAWTLTELWSLGGGSDGVNPASAPVLDSAGALYGTTELGGAFNKGAVYKLSPPPTAGAPWTETLLYSFTGGADGSRPVGGVIFGKNGSLYGPASRGGTAGYGTLFELTPPAVTGSAWTETTVHTFNNGEDGGYPVAPLTAGPKGALYGTTNYTGHGPAEQGTVFELSLN
jgi:uncharacterized repeat protein (TIGR03803 family)